MIDVPLIPRSPDSGDERAARLAAWRAAWAARLERFAAEPRPAFTRSRLHRHDDACRRSPRGCTL